MDEIAVDSKLLEIFADKPGQYQANMQATIASQNTISSTTKSWCAGGSLVAFSYAIKKAVKPTHSTTIQLPIKRHIKKITRHINKQENVTHSWGKILSIEIDSEKRELKQLAGKNLKCYQTMIKN